MGSARLDRGARRQSRQFERFGKAFAELREIGLIERLPRLAVINAAGANTLYELYEHRGLRWNGGSADMAIVDGYQRNWTPPAAALRPSPAPSKSIGP